MFKFTVNHFPNHLAVPEKESVNNPSNYNIHISFTIQGNLHPQYIDTSRLFRK